MLLNYFHLRVCFVLFLLLLPENWKWHALLTFTADVTLPCLMSGFCKSFLKSLFLSKVFAVHLSIIYILPRHCPPPLLDLCCFRTRIASEYYVVFLNLVYYWCLPLDYLLGEFLSLFYSLLHTWHIIFVQCFSMCIFGNSFLYLNSHVLPVLPSIHHTQNKNTLSSWSPLRPDTYSCPDSTTYLAPASNQSESKSIQTLPADSTALLGTSLNCTHVQNSLMWPI